MPLKIFRRGKPPKHGPDRRIWHVRGTVRGQYVYETTGTSDQEDAEAYRATKEKELFEASVLGPRAIVSFERAARSYMKAESRSASVTLQVGRLREYFSTPHTIVLDDDDVKVVPKNPKLGLIDQDVADAAVDAIVGEYAPPGTKNGVYTYLIAILNHAAWRKWCGSPKIKKKKAPKGKTRWLTPAEALALLDAAAPHLRPLILFLLCTGARVSEAVGLSWTDVDLAEARVVFRNTKAEKLSDKAKPRVARLTPSAVAALASLPHRSGAVFRTDDGEPYVDRNREEGGQIKTAWRTACRRAGLIRWEADDGDSGQETIAAAEGPCTPVRWVPTATPHTLRHTFASWFYALCKDLLLLKDEGGWSTTAMVERYAHLMTSDLVWQIALVWGPSHPRIGALPAGAKSVQLTATA